MATRKEHQGGREARESPAEVQATVKEYDPVHHTADPGGQGTATERASKAVQAPQGAGGIKAHRGGGGGGGVNEGTALDPGVGEEAKESASKGPMPGKPVEWSTSILDAGRDLLQRFAPLKSVHEHVAGFHCYAHDMTRQVEAHHYCSHPTDEFRQCIIFDSDQPGARLIGVEYIVSERVFKDLPEEEKKYWHSHRYEVESGMLIAPHVPGPAERQDMQKLAFTYGKTFHTWQVDRGDTVPLGPPQLMMAFTSDGQLDPALLAARDARYGVVSQEKREERKGLEYPQELDPAADRWKSGEG